MIVKFSRRLFPALLCTAPGCTAAAGWRSTSARAPASPRSRTAAAAPPGTPAATPGCNTTKYFCTFLQIFSTRPIFAWLPETICTAKRVYRVTVQSRPGNRSRVWRHAPSCTPLCWGTLSWYWQCARLWGLSVDKTGASGQVVAALAVTLRHRTLSQHLT